MTISELRLALDIGFDHKSDVLKRHAKQMSNKKYLFVDSFDGKCYLFGRNGNEDDISKLTHIEARLFYDDDKLKSIAIPENATRIGWGAFDNCSGLTNVTIPDSVTSIEDYAFFYCRALTSVVIPDNVTSIGTAAFEGCSGLICVTIPDSVISIKH